MVLILCIPCTSQCIYVLSVQLVKKNYEKMDKNSWTYSIYLSKSKQESLLTQMHFYYVQEVLSDWHTITHFMKNGKTSWTNSNLPCAIFVSISCIILCVQEVVTLYI